MAIHPSTHHPPPITLHQAQNTAHISNSGVSLPALHFATKPNHTHQLSPTSRDCAATLISCAAQPDSPFAQSYSLATSPGWLAPRQVPFLRARVGTENVVASDVKTNRQVGVGTAQAVRVIVSTCKRPGFCASCHSMRMSASPGKVNSQHCTQAPRRQVRHLPPVVYTNVQSHNMPTMHAPF